MSSRRLLYTALIAIASSLGYALVTPGVNSLITLALPPYIANRDCYAPLSSTALISDCQTAVNNLASQTTYISGPKKGCLEASTSGTCGITICDKVLIDPVAVAVAAQDVIAGCEGEFTGSGANQVVFGTIQMKGFTNGKGGTNNLFTLWVGKSGVAKRSADSQSTLEDSAVSSSTLNSTAVTATAQPNGKLVRNIVRNRVEAHEPATLVDRTPPASAPTWVVTDAPGIVLRAVSFEATNWDMTPTQQDALAFGVANNWHNQAITDWIAYNSQRIGNGNWASMGYYAYNEHDLGDVDPDDSFWIASAMMDFRAFMGNPGWFAVQVLSQNVPIGQMIFDIGRGMLL